MAPGDQHLTVDGHDIRISNLNKFLYPATATTENDVLHYYAAVAPLLIRYASGRS